MSSSLTSRDFLEIFVEYLQCHGQVTLEHEGILVSEAAKCLREENELPSLACNTDVDDLRTPDGDQSVSQVEFIRGAFDAMSPSEQHEFIRDLVSGKGQGLFQIPIEDVRQCYLKEVGENCSQELAQKIANQVSRDLDMHKSIYQQIREACQSAVDENMLALLSI